MKRPGLGRKDRINVALYAPVHRALNQACAQHMVETGERLWLTDAVEEAVHIWLELRFSDRTQDVVQPALKKFELERLYSFAHAVRAYAAVWYPTILTDDSWMVMKELLSAMEAQMKADAEEAENV